MKISEKVIRFGLIAMIGLSFYFSYVIWLSPANKGTVKVDESTAQMVASDAQVQRKASEVFLPLRVTRFNGESIDQSNSENLINHLQATVSAGKFGSLKEISVNEQEFNSKKKVTKGFEFNYNAPFSLMQYQESFKLNLSMDDLPDNRESLLFDRVQFDQQEEKVRFFDFKNQKIYEAEAKMDWKKLSEYLDTGKWMVMAQPDALLPRQYDTGQPVKLKKYSYILSQQPYTLFRNAFFKEADEVRNNDESKELIFYGGNETLSIHSENQIVDFQGELDESTEKENSIFGQSYPYISKLGNNLGNLRYFDRTNNVIDYRTFVEGFPVFGTESKGRLSLEIQNKGSEGQVHIQTSLNAIQVPIPSDEEVELPTTATILEQLLAAGAEKGKIQSVIIGYTWQNIKETNRVVDLSPEWYIQYENQWYSNSELLSKLPELEAK